MILACVIAYLVVMVLVAYGLGFAMGHKEYMETDGFQFCALVIFWPVLVLGALIFGVGLLGANDSVDNPRRHG